MPPKIIQQKKEPAERLYSIIESWGLKRPRRIGWFSGFIKCIKIWGWLLIFSAVIKVYKIRSESMNVFLTRVKGPMLDLLEEMVAQHRIPGPDEIYTTGGNDDLLVAITTLEGSNYVHPDIVKKMVKFIKNNHKLEE